MPWQGRKDLRVDRFDGRVMLDTLPPVIEATPQLKLPARDAEMADRCQFERYRDLIEKTRLGGACAEAPSLPLFVHACP